MGTPLAPLRCFIDASPRGPRRANPNTRGRRAHCSASGDRTRRATVTHVTSTKCRCSRGCKVARAAGPSGGTHTQARFADVNWTAVCVRTVTDLCRTVTDRYGPVSVVPQSGPLGKVCNLAVAASGGKCVARRARAAHPITRCYEMPPLGTEAVHTPLASVNGFSL